MDLDSAKRAAASILRGYVRNQRSLYRAIGRDQGKIYELFVLSVLLYCLKHTGCQLVATTATIRFKGKPGFIQRNDTAFEVLDPFGKKIGVVHLNIQYHTLGSALSAAHPDRSFFHEFDISIARPAATTRPVHDDLMLGIECKSAGKMSKSYVREVLGLRREMSLYSHDPPQQSLLSSEIGSMWNTYVSSQPESEIYLAFSDVMRGNKYKSSPALFSVFLVGLRP